MCGLRAAQSKLELRDNDSPIALIRRFDRRGNTRIPYISARTALDWKSDGRGFYSDIAAVVIGGTSLFGGVGGIFGTVVGACLIGVLTNGLVLLNVSSFIQQIVIGVILVAAVAFDQFAAEKRQ